jgi:hypothetical protein
MEALMRWAIACALLIAVTAPAAAQVQTDVGVLTCTLAHHGEQGTDPDSQTRAMLCSFKPTGTGPEESYTGEIKKVGTRTELSGKRVLIWAVMGPADRKLRPAVLEQTYVGKSEPDADASQPSKLLVGERDDAYALHPITDDTKEPSAADGVTVIELKIKSTAS